MFNITEEPQWDDLTTIAGFCQDSASVARIFQTQSGSEYYANDADKNETNEICNIQAESPYRYNCSALRRLKM